MRAVWSFWAKPYFAGNGFRWGSELHHFLAWVLSVRLAGSHYPETALVTDSTGKALLVDALGLSFSSVSTELDGLCDADPRLWVLGKLLAYSLQDRPFVHLDTDVFLWKPLPDRLTSAPVFGQQPERHYCAGQLSPIPVETSFARYGCELPAEWQYARSRWGRRLFYQINCGIVGGARHDFFRHFGEVGLDLVLGSQSAQAWTDVPEAGLYNTIAEQFLLAACVEYHRFNPRSPYRGIETQYLFRSWDDAFNGGAARAGFTHLLADAKRNSQVLERLERRIKEEDFALYERCRRLSVDIQRAPEGPRQR